MFPHSSDLECAGISRAFCTFWEGKKKGRGGGLAFSSTYESQLVPLVRAPWPRSTVGWCGFGHCVSQVRTVAGSRGLLVAPLPRPAESHHILSWPSILPWRRCPAPTNQPRGMPGFSGSGVYWSWAADTHGWQSVRVYLSDPKQEVWLPLSHGKISVTRRNICNT